VGQLRLSRRADRVWQSLREGGFPGALRHL
jgi:hypothetical protein